jgi:glycosyltransferase involved in cell wall biosynthesis
MKIAVVSEWFSEGVGYAENFFPMALGRLGHEVHLLTSDMQIYATSPDYDRIYRARLGPSKVDQGVWPANGFTLHRLEGRPSRLGMRIPKLADALTALSPQIVYCFEIASPTTLTAATLRRRLGFKLFCESRLHSSVLPAAGFATRLGRLFRLRRLGVPTVVENVEAFYPIAPDVLLNITRYLGVPKDRCRPSSLAVETQMFHPSNDQEQRRAMRARLGLGEADLVCIYTGRLTSDKGPLVLAQAVDALQSRGLERMRAVFVGEGDSEFVAKIAASKGCIVHPFVAPTELPAFYRCADIGVWPLQESTSQLDAMACGLPLVVNDTVEDPARLGDVGRTFRKDDVEHLAATILELDNPAVRAAMGAAAADRISQSYSWDALARRRADDFERALAAQ